jgi:hypothetical protein
VMSVDDDEAAPSPPKRKTAPKRKVSPKSKGKGKVIHIPSDPETEETTVSALRTLH